MIPDAAVVAGVAEVERITAVPDLEAERVSGETPEGFVVRAVLTAALPHLLTDEMVERAAEAIADERGYALNIREEVYAAAYWKQIARGALEAALGGAA